MALRIGEMDKTDRLPIFTNRIVGSVNVRPIPIYPKIQIILEDSFNALAMKKYNQNKIKDMENTEIMFLGESVSYLYIKNVLIDYRNFDDLLAVMMINNFELIKYLICFEIIKKMFKKNYYYIIRFCNLEIILLFDEINFDGSKITKSCGLYPIQAAVILNDHSKVKYLLNRSTKIANTILKNGFTILQLALYFGNFDIIDEFIKHGAKLKISINIKINEITMQYLEANYVCDVCYEVSDIVKTYCGCKFRYCSECKSKMKLNKCCACKRSLNI